MAITKKKSKGIVSWPEEERLESAFDRNSLTMLMTAINLGRLSSEIYQVLSEYANEIGRFPIDRCAIGRVGAEETE
jgi:hypothetical protein